MDKEEINNQVYFEEGKGPVLVFVPPWIGNHLTFQPMISYLKKDYTCKVLEIPGYGYSPEFKTKKHNIKEFAQCLDDFIISINGSEEIILIGCSLGCAIILEMLHKKLGAEISKPKIAGLVLLSPLLHKMELDKKGKIQVHFILEKTPIPYLLKWLSKFKLGRKIVYYFGDDNTRSVTFNKIDKYALETLNLMSVKSIRESTISALNYSLPENLKVNIPTTILYGKEDWLYHKVKPESFSTLFHNTFSCIGYPGGFHFLLIQNPKLMANAIRKFSKTLLK